MRSEEGGDPMTVEEMKKKKTELGFSCEQISDRSGVPLGTVQKIFSGITKRPRYDTICQLGKAFPIEHIIFTDPRVSTAGSFFIIEFCFIIL